ncbi:ABC transporter ATP-binding protein [Tundrisphaera lichenicola]|uniref:ABC transporter ATP-binding protein n=1 Tax=Tundrisphaera lichenicola TaxID=2029860 RepID=UPI003EB9263A
MFPKMVRASNGLWREVGNIFRRGGDVWRLVPTAQKGALGAAGLAMASASLAETSIAPQLGRLFDAVQRGKTLGLDRSALLQLCFGALGLIGLAYLARETMNVLRRFLVENACTRIEKNLCVRLVSHLMEVDLSTHSHEQVGAIHGRIQRSVEGYVRFLRLTFLDFIPALFRGGFALIYVFTQQPRIAIAMAGVVPISMGLTLWQLVTQNGVRMSLLRIREAMDGTVVEQLGGIDYVRAAHTHTQEIRRVEHAAERRRSKEIRHHFEMSLFGSGKAINEGFFYLLVVASAVLLYIGGHIESGEMIMFPILFLQVMAPLNEVHRFIDEGHECSLRVADLLNLLDEPVDRSFRPVEVREPRLDGSVPLFETEGLQVDYRTSGGQFKRALNGVDLTIYPGETIGVAGRSGCGKSTWLKVMMRLIHPSAGVVKLGGVPIENVSREAIGDLIGYVGQNPFVFSGTIAQNIAYGSEDATEEEIRRSARMACIHDEIMAMPGGYDATVAERGQNLSGGQRQRLALARVFLKNPPILILDEGTSALDNISERKVQRAIHKARADRTVILVAHRLSTLLDTDRIFVFDEGRVVETGEYNELVRRGGAFTDLVHSVAVEESAPAPVPGPSMITESIMSPVSFGESSGVELHSIFDVTAHGEPVEVA